MISENRIHGHEVLHLVHHASPPLTHDQLRAEVARLWGPQVSFHTCSSEGLTLDELVDFLISRGKIVENQGLLKVEIGEVCSEGKEVV